MVRGWVEMDDTGQGVDMDASCNDVSRHECIRLPLGEGIERPLALTLRAVAVHRHGAHAMGLQLADHAIGSTLGAAEHERLPVLLNQFGRDRHAFGPIHLPEEMGDVTLGLLGRLDGDPDRVTLVAANDRFHLAADGRREKEDLAVRCGLVEQATNRREEPHIRHPVRFVQHDRGDVLELHVAPLNEVFKASRAGHDDIDALVQRPYLIAVPGTAEDRDHPLAVVPEEAPDDIVHLGGQLPRRHEHKCPRAAGARLHGVDDEWEAESERLARARGCLAADVPSCEGRRDRLRLNGQGFCDALARETLVVRRGDAKV